MKLVIYQRGGEPPIAIEADRVSVLCGKDHFEMRQQLGHDTDSCLLVSLEEHDGGLTRELAVFPSGANAVRLKGGLR